MQLATAII